MERGSKNQLRKVRVGKTILCLVTAYRLEGNKEKTLREALKGVWEEKRLLIYEHFNEHFRCKRTSMAVYTCIRFMGITADIKILAIIRIYLRREI